MDSYLKSCLQPESPDMLISAENWSLLWEDAKLRENPLYNTIVQAAINSSDDTRQTIKTLQIRKELLHRIQVILKASQVDLNEDGRIVKDWACKSYRFTHEPVEGDESCVCMFSNKAHTVMLKANFFYFNTDIDKIEESPTFYYSTSYGTIIRCWNMLSRFEHFLNRLVHLHTNSISTIDKESSLTQARALPRAVNYVARFLHQFMTKVHSRKTCDCMMSPLEA